LRGEVLFYPAGHVHRDNVNRAVGDVGVGVRDLPGQPGETARAQVVLLLAHLDLQVAGDHVKALVGLVVDGDYEELRVASGDRLRVEDLRRRVEDDCPESLVLPAREIYQVEAIAKSDDPDLPGWAYFLDLWTETGPARLHIEGELEESGGRFKATLKDILP